MWWVLFATDGLVILAAAIAFRWLLRLQHRTTDNAERIARLEGSNDRDTF